MSDSDAPEIGEVGWIDLTVDDAKEIRDFYAEVVGWEFEPVNMGNYEDFTMISPESEEPTAGICHARGTNAGLPAQWMIYITVADIDRSVDSCRARRGTVLAGPKDMGDYGRYAVIRDPAGAISALFEPALEDDDDDDQDEDE